MNRYYRLIWNERTGAWIPVAEIAKGRGKRASALVLAGMLGLASASVLANPQGGQVVAGSASITTAPNLVTVN